MSFHPDQILPDCMMPDGGDCCAGHAAVCEDWHRQRREIERLSGAPAQAERETRTGAHLLQTAKSLGWLDDGEGALEFMLRRAREVAFEDCGHPAQQPLNRQQVAKVIYATWLDADFITETHFAWYEAGKDNPSSCVHYSNVAKAFKVADRVLGLASRDPWDVWRKLAEDWVRDRRAPD